MGAGDPVGQSGAHPPPVEEVTSDDLLGAADPAPTEGGVPEPEVGELVAGYELLELLGQGGAGSVFRASHPEYGQVALKILATAKLNRPRVVRRFRDEAAIVSAVKHAALVEFVEVVEQGDPPRLAYAMELVRGISLREKLQHANVLALTEAIHIAKQMCLGVGALHEAGVVHRDLKPENVMLIAPERPGQQMRVKILDFGVAKQAQGSDSQLPGMDEVPGTFVGTPRYMAPEQAAGGEVDGRADLFAIGVMLFEMITGQRPHEGDTLKAVVMAKLKGAPRLTMNPDRELLPQELADIVDACLKLQPDLRPKDARAVMHALDEAQMVLAAVGSVRLDGATKVVRAPTSVGVPPASSRPSIPTSMISAPSQPPAPALASSLPPPPPPVLAAPVAVGAQPEVEVSDPAARRRTLVALGAVLGAVVAVIGGAWVLLGEDDGNLLLATPQEYARPAVGGATVTATRAAIAAAPPVATEPAPDAGAVPSAAPSVPRPEAETPRATPAPVEPPRGALAPEASSRAAPASESPRVGPSPVESPRAGPSPVESPRAAPSPVESPPSPVESPRAAPRPDAGAARTAAPRPTPEPDDEVDVEVEGAHPTPSPRAPPKPPPPPADEIP